VNKKAMRSLLQRDWTKFVLSGSVYFASACIALCISLFGRSHVPIAVWVLAAVALVYFTLALWARCLQKPPARDS